MIVHCVIGRGWFGDYDQGNRCDIQKYLLRLVGCRRIGGQDKGVRAINTQCFLAEARIIDLSVCH
jgi:hypothetical protein